MKIDFSKLEKGITLIALIITIIILLILAGVTIGTLSRTGIFNKARQIASNYTEASLNEQIQLNEVEEYIDENKGNGSSQSTPPPAPTYTAYVMGDTVTLGGEDFWVIEDSDSDTSIVKLLAKLNVITTAGNANRYKQNSGANKLRFDDNSNDYATSEIKQHVDAYKTAVEGRMGAGKTIEEARLMTGTNSSGEVYAILSSSLTNKTSIVYGPNYWLGTPYSGSGAGEWFVDKDANCVNGNGNNVNVNWYCGLRPLLIVEKSNI